MHTETHSTLQACTPARRDRDLVRALGALVLAAGTLVTGPAWAQQDGGRELRGEFTRPIEQQGAARQQGASSRATSTMIVNGRSYSVEVADGVTTVSREGKKLDESEYRVRNNSVQFLDKNGDVELSMDLPSAEPQVVRRRGGMSILQPPRPPQPAQAPRPLVAESTPPVMLGITMSDEDDGVMVDSVRDDLPADKAGLREGDIITKIGDEEVTRQRDLRTFLMKAQPDQKVDIVVLRDGKTLTLPLTLEKWDSDRLGAAAASPVFPAQPNDNDWNAQVPGLAERYMHGLSGEGASIANDALDEAEKGLQEAIKGVESARGDLEEVRKDVVSALRDALEELRNARDELSASGNTRLLFPREGQGMTLTLPQQNREVEKLRELVEQQRRSRDDEMRTQMEELRKQMEELRREMRERRNDR
jgi:membrane-associated protease RseP (regulator of RpoE activity)